MAYDQALERRLRSIFSDRKDVEVKKMFGGLCFMVLKHMCCGIVGDTLMARVGPEQHAKCLSEKYAREMDFTGKALKGMVYVTAEGVAKDADLKKWVDRCTKVISSLRPKGSD
jgi:TfoX/Sxy family transcriptional regulator of competence genes